MLDIERRIYEWVRIGDIYVRVLAIAPDVGNGLVVFGIDDKDHRMVLGFYEHSLPMGDVLRLGPGINIESLKLERYVEDDIEKYKVRMGINAPRHVEIERDDMKKKKRKVPGSEPISTADDRI